MADVDPHEPIHEPAVAFLDEEAEWVHEAAERFEHASAQELLGVGAGADSTRGWRSARPAASTAWR